MSPGKTLLSFTISLFLLVPGCGDFADNAMGINGQPSQNRPLSTEGTWQGEFAPAQRWRHETLKFPEEPKKPCVTKGAQVYLESRSGIVTGQVQTAEGQAFRIEGEAWPGTWFTGKNSITARLYRNGADIGHLSLVPGRGVNQLSGTYLFRLGTDRYACSSGVTLTRITDPTE